MFAECKLTWLIWNICQLTCENGGDLLHAAFYLVSFCCHISASDCTTAIKIPTEKKKDSIIWPKILFENVIGWQLDRLFSCGLQNEI